MYNRPVNRKAKELVACDKCGCTVLSAVQVGRFSSVSHSLYAKPIPLGDTFWMLKCAKCNNIVFPPIDTYMVGPQVEAEYTEIVEELVDSEEDLEDKKKRAVVTKKIIV